MKQSMALVISRYDTAVALIQRIDSKGWEFLSEVLVDDAGERVGFMPKLKIEVFNSMLRSKMIQKILKSRPHGNLLDYEFWLLEKKAATSLVGEQLTEMLEELRSDGIYVPI